MTLEAARDKKLVVKMQTLRVITCSGIPQSSKRGGHELPPKAARNPKLGVIFQNVHLCYESMFRSRATPAWISVLLQGFFSNKFFMGGMRSKFLVPVGPWRGQSRMGGGGTCKKNLTEVKTAHLMQKLGHFLLL